MILSSFFFFFPIVSYVADLELKQLNKTRTSKSADKKKKKPPLFSQRTKKGTAQQTENCLAEHRIKKNPVVPLNRAIKGQVWPLDLFYCF